MSNEGEDEYGKFDLLELVLLFSPSVGRSPGRLSAGRRSLGISDGCVPS